jgi:catechol 2,3-dioxygenase-like lactoylglutathione lyase family enzyme
MIKKVSHIGIGVRNLEEARSFFKENFALASSEQTEVPATILLADRLSS